MSTPRRRQRDREPLNQIAGTLATVPTATGDTSNQVDGLVLEPTYDEIARRAYQLYEERGGEHGRDQEDWLQAERDVRQSLQDAVGRFLTAESPYAVV
jgi:hypothetical protein